MMEIEKIPPLPNVVIRVMAYDYESASASAVQLSEIVAPDKSICAELLKIANSAYYGRSGKIKNVKDAVTLLGLKAVKNLVIFISSLKLASALKGETFRKYLTEFPIFSALISMDLANALDLKSRRDDAFMYGLLHRIGMIMIALNKNDHYSLLIEQAEENNFDLLQLELKAYKTDHQKVADLVCRAWKLPGEFMEVVHGVSKSESEIRSSDPMIRIILMADILARKGTGIKISKKDENLLSALFDTFDNGGKAQIAFNDGYLKLLKDHPFYSQTVA